MFVNYVLFINVSIYNDMYLFCDKSILLLYMYNVNINLIYVLYLVKLMSKWGEKLIEFLLYWKLKWKNKNKY